MSQHVETGQCLSSEIINKLKQFKNLLQASYNKRQLLLGLFDLSCHILSVGTDFNPKECWDQIERVIGSEPIPEMHFYACFYHIITEYDAGYYGYLLSKAYATHMFYTQFKDGNLLNNKVGQKYRKYILEPGSSK